MRSTVALDAKEKGRERNNLTGPKYENTSLYFLRWELLTNLHELGLCGLVLCSCSVLFYFILVVCIIIGETEYSKISAEYYDSCDRIELLCLWLNSES